MKSKQELVNNALLNIADDVKSGKYTIDNTVKTTVLMFVLGTVLSEIDKQ